MTEELEKSAGGAAKASPLGKWGPSLSMLPAVLFAQFPGRRKRENFFGLSRS